MKIIKKLLYYKDIGLLIKVFFTSLRISFVFSKNNLSLIIKSIPAVNRQLIKQIDKDKINRYVNLCVFILRRLGFRYTCLTYSALLCNVLRQAGIEARVNFGAKKIDFTSDTGINMAGHCWVTVGNQKLITSYQYLFKYP